MIHTGSENKIVERHQTLHSNSSVPRILGTSPRWSVTSAVAVPWETEHRWASMTIVWPGRGQSE